MKPAAVRRGKKYATVNGAAGAPSHKHCGDSAAVEMCFRRFFGGGENAGQKVFFNGVYVYLQGLRVEFCFCLSISCKMVADICWVNGTPGRRWINAMPCDVEA